MPDAPKSDSPGSDLLGPDVLRVSQIDYRQLSICLGQFGLAMSLVESGQAIPGSHWGDDEAGLIKNTLFARQDTPVHSALHEGCHWILMDPQRRQVLHTDAGGTATEENAVCYLQILLAEQISGFGQTRMLQDMDSWGYSFRLGSAAKWFADDADDAIGFLRARGFDAMAATPDFSVLFQEQNDDERSSQLG